MEIDDGPLPTSSEVISVLALVRRYCLNVEGCDLSCSDSLDNVEALELNMELPQGVNSTIGQSTAASTEQDELTQRLAKLRQL
ncbi:hypothetical protein HPB51_012538 [Rhipicephalus microplus]|uniref:Uncharacterized protein n=1 Tax=Rhipicephalus microplus TaxID=6941 RepID=A0A9J6DGD0_RHIMP|nr:hypothetical protein HPB51_012538 [Rhipicephalus microplus]